jgi:uncharacterized membrane protein
MGDVETLARGDDSRLVEPRRFLIRDRQAFAAVWAAHAGPNAMLPPVDFDTRMVAAVFAGERPTPGFSVEVTGTRRDGSEPGAGLVVLVDERHPDASRVAAQVIVSPFHIVTLPRDDGEIRFNLPDSGGYQTIVFRSPPRPHRRPVSWAAREEVSSFTGLMPHVAATLAYLAGPFSGALLLATEPASLFVRFHAWQAVLGLGLLGAVALFFLIFAFIMLLVSPTAFWVFLWLAAATGAAWIVVWAFCVVNAYKGRVWKLPLAGAWADKKPLPTIPRASGAP